MLKAVIFDLDGVITDTAAFHFMAWQKLAESLGIKLTKEFNENLKGVDREESLRRILALGNQEMVVTTAEKQALADQKNTDYVSLINQITPKDILPGIVQLLDDLQANKILIGLASASRNAPKILNNLGLATAFDTVVDPTTLKEGKPSPEIFIKACQQLKIAPHEAIGVEDAYSGIQAINHAKILSVGIGDKETLKAADYVLPTTQALTFEQIKAFWQSRK